MKKIILSLLFLGILTFSVFAQAGLKRPRVVSTDNISSDKKKAPDQNSISPDKPSSSSPKTDGTELPPNLNQKKELLNSNIKNDKNADLDGGEVIKVETDLVTLPVAVSDLKGRLISGLKQEDFDVYEDGVQQKVEYFASLEQPFTVVLLIDVSNSTAFKIEEIQNAAITFVNQLRNNDRIIVISFDREIHILNTATSNRSILTSAIRQLQFGGATSLYEAIDKTINSELAKIEGRKAIVLFTDGVDTTSTNATYSSSIAASEELAAMIYPICFDTFTDMNTPRKKGGKPPTQKSEEIVGNQIYDDTSAIINFQVGTTSAGTSLSDYERGKRYLEDLARTSGGRSFEANNTTILEAAFSGIAEELRQQYSIGYYPEDIGQDGQRRLITVQTTRLNAVVRAKNSYIVRKNRQ